MIFIPKPAFDLSVTKNWQALNVITYVGKLLGKMIDYWIQDCIKELFYMLQFGLVKGHSTVDVWYRSV